MPTNQQITQNFAEHTVHFDVDLSATGAVTATRGDGIVCTKTGTGTYTVTVTGIPFYEVTSRQVQLHQATPTAFWATITGINVNSNGNAVISITTCQANAAPVATNIAAAGVLSGDVTFRRWKVVSP